MTKRIKVTLGHIAKGKRGHPTSCPVHFAIADAGYPNNSVGDEGIYPTGDLWGVRIPRRELPEVDKAIKHFDATGQMSPFEFDLDI